MSYILFTKKLKSGYKNFTLKNISIKIKGHSITGIIGPNGSGKSTLLKSLTLNIQPIGGSIFYQGINIKEYQKKELAQEIAVVSQIPNTPIIKVKDYVLLGRIPYYGRFQFFETKENIKIAEKIMGYINIHQFRDRYLNELSGGEKQLCHIARALVQQPKFLILDEPTNFLDITHQTKIMDLIYELNTTQKTTILLVMHDLNLASEYCDYLFLMEEGQIKAQGKPREVLVTKNIKNTYQTSIVIKNNPISNKPFIYLISKKINKNIKNIS